MPRLAICIAATLALGANALPMLGLDPTTVKENIAKTQGKEAAEKFAAHWAKIKSMHGGHHAAATSHSSGGFWAKAQAFFTAYKRKSDPSKPNKMPGFAGIGGFMKQYDDSASLPTPNLDECLLHRDITSSLLTCALLIAPARLCSAHLVLRQGGQLGEERMHVVQEGRWRAPALLERTQGPRRVGRDGQRLLRGAHGHREELPVRPDAQADAHEGRRQPGPAGINPSRPNTRVVCGCDAPRVNLKGRGARSADLQRAMHGCSSLCMQEHGVCSCMKDRSCHVAKLVSLFREVPCYGYRDTLARERLFFC